PGAAFAHHLNRLADERERDGVTVALDRDKPVICHPAIAHHCLQDAGLPGSGYEGRSLLGEAIDGPLVRGAVDAQVSHLGLPSAKLSVEVLHVGESAARGGNSLEVLY